MLKLKRYPKRSPYWYVRGTVARQRIFESTGTCDRAQADAFRIRLEREIWDRAKLGIDARRPVSFAEAAIAYMEATGQKRFLAPLIEHFKETAVSEIGQLAIDSAAQLLCPGTSPATRIRHVYTPMLAVLNRAAELGLPGAARLRIRRPKVKRKPVEWASDAYLDRLAAGAGPRLNAIIQFMTETGVRVGEAIRLLPDDFTRLPGWAHVGRTKSGKPRLVPLSPALQQAIAAILPQEPFARVFGYSRRWSVNNALKRAARRGGVKYLSPHKVGRHAFAARLLAQGHTLKTVKEAGGWASLAVVDENYGHLEQSHAHQAMLDAACKRAESAERRRKEA